ncbi:MAG: hypothetical protein EHM83_05835 [Burkholderiales bacterium]|nr:MAG: hypothetical protein EHM83_05835 [Burkholderiales bacterium]
MIRGLALVACLLTVCITASSAFIRHWQGGLGCDGWPACYRAVDPAASSGAPPATTTSAATTLSAAPADRSAIDAAVQALARVPEADAPAPVRMARALHRVSATLVGVLVLLVAVFGWSTMGGGQRIAVAVALVDTVFLSWLGRYTPHDLPMVTFGNLLGGLLLAAALAWIAAARRASDRARVAAGESPADRPAMTASAGAAAPIVPAAVPRIALAALALLGLLAWGGTMIGARHAVDACSTPLCLGGVRFDAAALDPMQATVAVDAAAARGLHVAHRLLGVILAAVIALLALRLRAARPVVAGGLAVLAAAQILLGVGTVLGAQPLLTATLHNASAALLAVALAAVASRAATAWAAPRRASG